MATFLHITDDLIARCAHNIYGVRRRPVPGVPRQRHVEPFEDFAGAPLRKLGFGELDAAQNFEKEGSVLESRQNSFGLS